LPEGISIREFARREACNDKLVRRAIQGGFLTAFSDGSLDQALVGSAWRKSNREAADKAADQVRTVRTEPADIALEPQSHGGALKRAQRPPAEVDPEDLAEGETPSLAHSQRVKEHYLAQQRRLEYERLAGELVPVAEVAQLVGDEYARVRTRLLALAAEQSPRLHRLKTVAEVQDVLMGLVVEALEELTGDGAYSAPGGG